MEIYNKIWLEAINKLLLTLYPIVQMYNNSILQASIKQ
jgi:hypothetical protein